MAGLDENEVKTIQIKTSGNYNVIIQRGLLDSIGEMLKNIFTLPDFSNSAGQTRACFYAASDTEKYNSGYPAACDAGNKISGFPRFAIVANEDVWEIYGSRLEKSLKSAGLDFMLFKHSRGEQAKSLETYAKLLNFLCDSHIRRSDVIIAFGGGVTGDLAGFAAATYLRGIRYVQVPTTLLSQVDSSVGGKTGINLGPAKNQAGCFYRPMAVFTDPDFLKTLPEDQYLSGIAECIKCAVIADEKLFCTLEKYAEMHRAKTEFLTENNCSASIKSFSIPFKSAKAEYPTGNNCSGNTDNAYCSKKQCAEAMDTIPDACRLEEEIISRCIEIKKDIVEEDEFESGKRRLLNFGHTIGHALEKCSGYRILHGQAVAIGMAEMTFLAENADKPDRSKSSSPARPRIIFSAENADITGNENSIVPAAEPGTYKRLVFLLKAYGLPYSLSNAMGDFNILPSDLENAVKNDKKIINGILYAAVPEKIGKCRLAPIRRIWP